MKILIGDDAPISRRLLEAALTPEGYEVVFAADGNEALRILEEKDAPRLVILDRMLPMADGVEICQLIRERAGERYVYLILISAEGQQREIIDGLDEGADDYIIKPFHLSELRARLRSGRRIIELEEQLFAARELLRTRTINDPLTGVLTRAAIQELRVNEIARATREGRSIAIISANLDQLEVINDTYGHSAGDAVLVEAAQRMRSSMRKYDAIGRSGGDEFLIVSPGCNGERAAVLADRLRSWAKWNVSS